MRYMRAFMISIPLLTSIIIPISIIFLIRLGSCPEGYFTCGKSDVCIIQKNICNGVSECPNIEDEDPMFCADLYGGFWGMVNNLQYIPPNETCVLDGVPNGCNCSDYTVLICSEMSLRRVPSNIPPETERLILTKNSISLKESDFGNCTLQVINLGDNSISHLPNKVFHGQRSLKKLFLFKNNLTELPQDIFYGLKNLSWLFLNENNITVLNFETWELESLIWLDLSHNQINLNRSKFPNLPMLSLLHLDWNLIEEITSNTFSNLPLLTDLSLGWNNIKVIDSNAFYNLTKLQDLNLRNNELIYLSETLFVNNKNLQKLNLGGNGLLIVTNKLLWNLPELRSLNLEDVNIDNINSEMFAIMQNLEFIYFKRFKYCMYAPQVPKCSPSTDGTSSTVDFLVNSFMRLTLWLMASFILLANGLVLWHRIVTPVLHSPLNFIITNLAGSDLLMGFYLLIIGTQDLRYKGVYIVHATEWMSSWLCTTAGMIAMISSEVSVLLLFLISAERYLLIAVPLRRQTTLKFRVAVLSTLAIWIVGLIVSLMPVLNWRDSTRFYGTNKFCFPLHIDEPFLIGWHYSAFVFLGLNSLGLLSISFLYYRILKSIYQTRKETTLNVRDSDFLLRFFFIILTNCCCWIPIIILKLLAIVGIEFSGELYGWLTIFILPVNSAVNPVLYTFSTPRHVNERTGATHEESATFNRKLTSTISLRSKRETAEYPKTNEEDL